MFNFLLLFCLIIPFQLALSPKEGIDLVFGKVLVPMIFLFWFLDGLRRKKLKLNLGLEGAFLLSFFFWCAFSLFFAEEPNWGVRKLLLIGSFLPLFFVIRGMISSQRDLMKLAKFIVFGSATAAIVGIFQFLLQFRLGVEKLFVLWAGISKFFLGESFSEAVTRNNSWMVNLGGDTFFRAVSFFPDPHMAAFYFGMTAFLALGIFLDSRKREYLGLFFLLILADLLTFSRGGYVGLFSGAVFFGGSFLRNVDLKRMKKVVVVGLIVCVLIISSSFVRQRFLSVFDFSEGSNSGRVETWKQSWDVISENALLGTGLGNYALAVKPSALWREPIYSHNLYFDLWAEIGIVGLLFWFLTIFFSLKNLLDNFYLRKDALSLSIASGIIVFSVHSLFETAIFSAHILPLLLVLLALSGKKKGYYA